MEKILLIIVFNGLLELNENGIIQAKNVSKLLNNQFDVVISSPSKRTMETGEIISNKEIIIDNRLLEKGWGNNHDGNETDEEAITRFKRLFKELENKYKYKRVLLITYGILMRLAQDIIENKTITRDRVNNCDIISYVKKDNCYIKEV